MATRNFPPGAISELIADCPNELPGTEIAISKIDNNKIRGIDSSSFLKSAFTVVIIPIRDSFSPIQNPKSQIQNRLFDYLIRSPQQRLWNVYPDLLGRFEINDQVKLLGLLDWQIGRLGALQDLVHESCGPAV
jgi:hypothetical protein